MWSIAVCFIIKYMNDLMAQSKFWQWSQNVTLFRRSHTNSLACKTAAARALYTAVVYYIHYLVDCTK